MKNSINYLLEGEAKSVLANISLDPLEEKKILITGATGLLGVNLISCLRTFSLNTKYKPRITAVIHSPIEDDFQQLYEFENLKVVQGDLAENEFISSLGNYDFIIHAAGYGQPGKFMVDQVKTLKLNTLSTFSLLDRLSKDGRFLFLSSSEVYSGLLDFPYKEDQIGTTNTTHKRSCYIEAKRCGEAICNAFRNQGVQAFSGRLALAYGPGTKKFDNRVLNSFIERGLLQKKIALQDDGSANRTYCYITDAIEIMFHILFNGNNPIYNIGGKSKTTIAQLAHSIGKLLNANVEIPLQSNKNDGAPDDVALDMGLIAEEFGKTEYCSLDYGLIKTINYQKFLYR